MNENAELKYLKSRLADLVNRGLEKIMDEVKMLEENEKGFRGKGTN